jgi:hypothetical protein
MLRSAPAAVGALALFGVLLAGCRDGKLDRPATFPVRGQVHFQGKPATGARVQLTAADGSKWCPHGEVAVDGSFQLTTFRSNDGAPAGSYALTLTWPAPPPPGREEGLDRFKGRYADPKQPLRRVQVREGGNVLEPIELK